MMQQCRMKKQMYKAVCHDKDVMEAVCVIIVKLHDQKHVDNKAFKDVDVGQIVRWFSVEYSSAMVLKAKCIVNTWDLDQQQFVSPLIGLCRAVMTMIDNYSMKRQTNDHVDDDSSNHATGCDDAADHANFLVAREESTEASVEQVCTEEQGYVRGG